MVTLILGADHAGFELKEQLKEALSQDGIHIEDLTPEFVEGDDYPLVAQHVAKKVVHEGEMGLLICNSGIGMSIAANKIPGARAALCRTAHDASSARKDNDANICCVGSSTTNYVEAQTIMEQFLSEKFLGNTQQGKRHLRRKEQLEKL